MEPGLSIPGGVNPFRLENCSRFSRQGPQVHRKDEDEAGGGYYVGPTRADACQ